MRRFVLIAPLTLLAVDALADTRLYRCRDAQGQMIFSDESCGPAAEIVELDVRRPSAAQRYEAQCRAAEVVAIADEIRRRRDLERETEIQRRQARLQAQAQQAETAARATRANTGTTHTIIGYRPPPLPPPPPMGPPPGIKPDLSRPRPPRPAPGGLRPYRPDPDELRPPRPAPGGLKPYRPDPGDPKPPRR